MTNPRGVAQLALALRADGPGARAHYMKWTVYVLKSKKDNRRYIGSTNNLEKRIREHNAGKVKSTKNRKPLVLIYKEDFLTEGEARLRERFFKTHKGFNVLKKIIISGTGANG